MHSQNEHFFQEQSTSAIKEADYDEEKFEPGGKSIIVVYR